MEAKDHLVNDVLREGRRYMVPLYQRQYQWSSERLQPFWDDVAAKAGAMLDGSARFEHYMGALILAPGGDGYAIGVTPRVHVVDGQQRLTTFQLFLAALREVARDIGADDVVRQVGDYVLNPKKAADVDKTARYKLSPTPADRTIFHDIIDLERADLFAKYSDYYYANGKIIKGRAPAALYAYEFFRSQVSEFARFGTTEQDEQSTEEDAQNDLQLKQIRVETLLQALLSGMKLVVITLSEADDAQVIFETLNSQGQPLLAMDLVRNNIFHRAEAQGETAEQLYEELWAPFDAQWWREAAPRARPTLPRIDHFLAHVLTAQTGRATSMREIYAEYRAYARPKGQARFANVADELRVLTEFAPTYEALEGRIDGCPAINWLGRKLAAWEMKSAYPVALLADQPSVNIGERKAIARTVYSYIVRRGICGLSTKSIYLMFHRIAEAFAEDCISASVAGAEISKQTRDALRMPGDDEFARAIRERPLYNNLGAGRLVDILWELELDARTGFTEALSPPELSVEHVLPQSWGLGWPSLSGAGLTHESGTEEALDRNAILHRLGNLTLITGALNSSLGNDDFAAKCAKLDQHSILALNKTIVAAGTWDEAKIAQRGAMLAERALAIWPMAQASMENQPA